MTSNLGPSGMSSLSRFCFHSQPIFFMFMALKAALFGHSYIKDLKSLGETDIFISGDTEFNLKYFYFLELLSTFINGHGHCDDLKIYQPHYIIVIWGLMTSKYQFNCQTFTMNVQNFMYNFKGDPSSIDHHCLSNLKTILMNLIIGLVLPLLRPLISFVAILLISWRTKLLRIFSYTFRAQTVLRMKRVTATLHLSPLHTLIHQRAWKQVSEARWLTSFSLLGIWWERWER